MKGSVVCLGAAAMDLIFQVDRFPLADEMVFASGEPGLFPGGSTANIAAGLARLGVRARFVGKVGPDANGDALRAAFEHDGVDTKWLMTEADGRTAQTIIVVDHSGNRIIYSLGGTALLETPDELDSAIMDGVGLLYVGEAFPAVAQRAISQARSCGAIVAYGPGGATSWIEPDVLLDLLGKADYVLVSRGELRAITSFEKPRDGAICLLNQGARNVVVTLGSAGSECYGGEAPHDPWRVDAFRVQPVDTTGAGDSFAAGFAAGLIEGRLVQECLVRGNAMAAIAISRVGAREALPTRKELDAFLGTHLVEGGDGV
ncbi:MAG: carbohydrate kinase family protein [Clostridia bacterium]|nr:carbohydrate kinase family protein [Clostridia bacterium]